MSMDVSNPTSSNSVKLNNGCMKAESLRFELSLKQCPDSECPEFCYSDLVKGLLKKNKKLSSGSSSNKVDTEDSKEKNDALSMAKYFQKKYGSKKRHERVQDLADVGYGYDENDPFVDNSEYYDELIPSSLTTQFGGFYINSGKLEFKQVSDESSVDDDDSLPLSAHLKKKKITKLFSSDEDSMDMEISKKMKKRGTIIERDEKRRKLSLQGKDKLGKLSKTRNKKKPTKVQLLVAKAKKAQHQMTDKLSVSKQLSDKQSIELNGTVSHKDDKTGSKTSLISQIKDDDNASSGTDDTALAKLKLSKDESKLPRSIPSTIKEKISSLTKIAKSNEKEGKVKFFSPDVNHLLLGIEVGSQSLSNRERSGIYQHLTPHMPCSKDTLIRRMKKLRATEQDEILKNPLNQLKKAVNEVMDEQIKRYDEECAAQQLAKNDERNPLAASTDEDDDVSNVPSSTEEKTKRTYAPRRKFHWNDKLRSLLFEVVRVKLKQYESNKNSLSAEDYLKNFFELDVKPLWPKGWMQSRALFKESRDVHQHVTGQLKLKKGLNKNFSKATDPSALPSINRKPNVAKGEKKQSVSTLGSNLAYTGNGVSKFKEASMSMNLILDDSATLQKQSLAKQAKLMNRAILNAQKELSSPLSTDASSSKASSVQSSGGNSENPCYVKLSTSLLDSVSGPAKQVLDQVKSSQDYAKAKEANRSALKTEVTVNEMSRSKLAANYTGASSKPVSQASSSKKTSEVNLPIKKLTQQKQYSKQQFNSNQSSQKRASTSAQSENPSKMMKHSARAAERASNSNAAANSKSAPKKPSHKQPLALDAFSAELLKLALMSPPGGPPLLAHDFGYSPFKESQQPASLNELTDFMKLQQAALQKQALPGDSFHSISAVVNSEKHQAEKQQAKNNSKLPQATSGHMNASTQREKSSWRHLNHEQADVFHPVSTNYHPSPSNFFNIQPASSLLTNFSKHKASYSSKSSNHSAPAHSKSSLHQAKSTNSSVRNDTSFHHPLSSVPITPHAPSLLTSSSSLFGVPHVPMMQQERRIYQEPVISASANNSRSKRTSQYPFDASSSATVDKR